MAQQKKGFIARLLEGKERSEEYARSTLPTNRWQLGWDIFKNNFGKMVKANLLILLFCLPLIAVIVFKYLFEVSNGAIYPFGANLGVGYPAEPNLTGVAEMLSLQSGFVTYGLILVTSFITAVGLSGGMYVMRNMVWTEGVFVASDFWRGVKLNYKNALQTALFFTVVLFATTSLINLANYTSVAVELTGFERVWMVISKVFSYIFLVVAVLMSFWMISLGVNYTQGFFRLLRNSFLMAVGTLPQTVFFIALAAVPFLLFLIKGAFFTIIAVVIVVLFALSYALLVWLNFSQWVFDKYLNPKLQGAKVGRGIYNKDAEETEEDASAAALEYQRALLSLGRSQLSARPMKPIDDGLEVYELPTSFTREDLARLRKSKQDIADDTEAYVEEHKNDLQYVEYNRTFDEHERALQDETDKKGKKKKRTPPKLLGQ